MPVEFDFKPVNEGLNKMLQVSFGGKKAAIARFIGLTRTKLAEEKKQLDEAVRETTESNI